MGRGEVEIRGGGTPSTARAGVVISIEAMMGRSLGSLALSLLALLTVAATAEPSTEEAATPPGMAPVPPADFTLPRLAPRKHLPYREQELRYAQHHMYVNVQHKILYCAVPKVACTEFMRLFFRLKSENKDTKWKQDPHFRQDRPLFNKIMNVTTATRLINDPSWTKFAFFRDPAERLLSAYLDKFANGKRYMTGSYAVRIFKDRNMNFSGFVDRVASNNKIRGKPDGLHPNTNPHWRPQRFMCNMEKFLPAYNFVGSFDHLQDHAEKLLRSLGLWEDYGKSGWSRAGKPKLTAAERTRARAKAAVGIEDTGAGAMFEKNAAWHQTQKMKPANHDLYTPALLAKIKRAYAMDYEMFDAIGFGGLEPVDGANWGDAKYSERQTMGKYERSFKDDETLAKWAKAPPKG